MRNWNVTRKSVLGPSAQPESKPFRGRSTFAGLPQESATNNSALCLSEWHWMVMVSTVRMRYSVYAVYWFMDAIGTQQKDRISNFMFTQDFQENA
jgi:hypothetical protein